MPQHVVLSHMSSYFKGKMRRKIGENISSKRLIYDTLDKSKYCAHFFSFGSYHLPADGKACKTKPSSGALFHKVNIYEGTSSRALSSKPPDP